MVLSRAVVQSCGRAVVRLKTNIVTGKILVVLHILFTVIQYAIIVFVRYEILNNRFVSPWFPELYPAFYFIIKLPAQYKQTQVKQDFSCNEQAC